MAQIQTFEFFWLLLIYVIIVGCCILPLNFTLKTLGPKLISFFWFFWSGKFGILKQEENPFRNKGGKITQIPLEYFRPKKPNLPRPKKPKKNNWPYVNELTFTLYEPYCKYCEYLKKFKKKKLIIKCRQTCGVGKKKTVSHTGGTARFCTCRSPGKS